jgi:hypothetical protein
MSSVSVKEKDSWGYQLEGVNMKRTVHCFWKVWSLISHPSMWKRYRRSKRAVGTLTELMAVSNCEMEALIQDMKGE